MISEALDRLEQLCETIPPLILAMSEEEFSHKPAPVKWSKKEILGHLIDSATNNHQRFIRVQFEEIPVIRYDQDKWNIYNHYNASESAGLVAFWALYNKHLAALARRIPPENLKRQCQAGGNEPVTLEFLIRDYVVHLEHHLKQIVKYN